MIQFVHPTNILRYHTSTLAKIFLFLWDAQSARQDHCSPDNDHLYLAHTIQKRVQVLIEPRCQWAVCTSGLGPDTIFFDMFGVARIRSENQIFRITFEQGKQANLFMTRWSRPSGWSVVSGRSDFVMVRAIMARSDSVSSFE